MQGIDYGNGLTNVDKKTGIRYGVISNQHVGQAWFDAAEPVYPPLACPVCGSPVVEGEVKEYFCESCNKGWMNEDVQADEASSFEYTEDGYVAVQSHDNCDIFIMKSPYYTLCKFCSPCAPGAGYLMTPCDDGIKAYCFNHDWFEDNQAPYKVFRVDDNTEVFPD